MGALRLAVLALLVYSTLQTGCSLDSQSGDPDFKPAEAWLWFYPGQTLTDTPEQEIMIEAYNFSPDGCELEVFFGVLPAEVRGIKDVSGIYQPEPYTEVWVMVPSNLDGDFPVTLRCGEKLISAKDDRTYRARPLGWFISPEYERSSSGGGHASAVGDLDGDGFTDQVTASSTATWIAFNQVDPDGKIRAVEQIIETDQDSFITTLAVADLTGDGLLDIAQAERCELQLWINRGDRHFELLPATSWDCGHYIDPDLELCRDGYIDCPAAWGLVPGDLNGDGHHDLFVVMDDDPHQVLLGDGQGGFEAHLLSEVSDFPEVTQQGTTAALADLDSDGDLDVVVSNGWLFVASAADYQDHLLLNRGSGTFDWVPDAFTNGTQNTWSTSYLRRGSDPGMLVFGHPSEPPTFFDCCDQGQPQGLGNLGITSSGVISAAESQDKSHVLAVVVNGKQAHWYRKSPGNNFERIAGTLVDTPGFNINTIGINNPGHLIDLDRDGHIDFLTPGVVLFYRDLR